MSTNVYNGLYVPHDVLQQKLRQLDESLFGTTYHQGGLFLEQRATCLWSLDDPLSIAFLILQYIIDV